MYRKINPADAPVVILALTSDIYDRGQMYDKASSILQQALSQVDGVGQVMIGGRRAARRARRCQSYNALQPRAGTRGRPDGSGQRERQPPIGLLEDDEHAWSLGTSDQLLMAEQYKPLIISYSRGAAVRLSDIASVTDSVKILG